MNELRLLLQSLKKISTSEERVQSIDIWSQSKLVKRHQGKSLKHHPLIKFIKKLRNNNMIEKLHLQPAMLTLLLHDHLNQEFLAARVKISGLLRQLYQNREFHGEASVQVIVRNNDINRWEHLITSDSNKNKLNLSLSMALVDMNFIEDNVTEIPYDTTHVKIEDYNEEETVPEEKIKDFFNKEILSSTDVEGIEESKRGSEPIASSSSKECSLQSDSSKRPHLVFVADIKDNVVVNITNSSIEMIESELNNKDSKFNNKIEVKIGHEVEAMYTELVNGKEMTILQTSIDEENSSSDELESLEVPWSSSVATQRRNNFNGFMEADSDDVHELTKVITSHTLYIDPPGKEFLFCKRNLDR